MIFWYKLTNINWKKRGPTFFKFTQMQSISSSPVLSIHAPSWLSCVLFEFFYSLGHILVNSMTICSVLKLPKIARPSPLKCLVIPPNSKLENLPRFQEARHDQEQVHVVVSWARVLCALASKWVLIQDVWRLLLHSKSLSKRQLSHHSKRTKRGTNLPFWV